MTASEEKNYYAAYAAKDARFDGRFFVGISSTGIYCRPVCKARPPKPENCTFYATAAAAEKAGYRPCLLCRPELAPGTSITDASAVLALRAARMLEEKCGSGQSLAEIAERLGCSDRHLRRVFTAEYQVTPVQYLQTCRLLLAKNLLTDTELPVLQIAMAAGFGSLRRFNDLFKEHYQLSPSALRKGKKMPRKKQEDITVNLGYRPPYRWQEMLQFLSHRAITGVDMVQDEKYLRTVRLVTDKSETIFGELEVSHNPKKNALSVTMSEALLPALPQVLAKVRQLFDLYCEPDAVYDSLQVMNDIKPGSCVLGTRLPGCFETFEMAVRAVLGQQITVKAASTLAARMVQAYGVLVKMETEGLTHVFPGPDEILALGDEIEDCLGVLGITSARARTIRELAKAFARGEIDFTHCLDPEAQIRKLINIPGVGNWTAQYIAMRTMSWTDAFLETDVGIRKALPGHIPKELFKMAEAWRPWRSYATINLWNTL